MLAYNRKITLDFILWMANEKYTMELDNANGNKTATFHKMSDIVTTYEEIPGRTPMGLYSTPVRISYKGFDQVYNENQIKIFDIKKTNPFFGNVDKEVGIMKFSLLLNLLLSLTLL